MIRKILTNEQMAAADAATIKSGIDGYTLMARAAQAVVDEAQKAYEIRSALVLCGPGNNGGDGLVIARILQEQGYPVRVAVLKDDFKGDAAKARAGWGGEVSSLDKVQALPHDVVFDALFGTGFSGEIPEVAAEIFEALEVQPVVAVDVPSGVQADLTVTFHYKKTAHVLHPQAGLCGRVVVRDIGIGETDEYAALENDPALWRPALPRKSGDSHKYHHGHALIYGAPAMTGATRLAAAVCARAGAGLTTVLAEQKADVYRAALPPHIIVRDDLAWNDERVTARLYGSGGLPCKVDYSSDLPTVLDADALIDLPARLRANHILTPHEGEFARAFPAIKGNKIERAKEAARQTGGVVVLKGQDTVVARADGRCVVNAHASPFLASAGTGDVLAGLITAFLAQGMEPFDAACAAVWIHGEAGRRAGYGLVASDLERYIPEILQELLGIADNIG